MTAFERMPAPAPARYVQVAVNLPLRQQFTYRLPEGMTARPGNRVRVPFHGRAMAGVVTAVTADCELPPARVKTITAILDAELLLPPSLLQLAERMAATYGCSLGEALDATLPAAAKRSGRKRIPHLELLAPRDLAQHAVLELEDTQQARSRVLRAVLEYGGPMPLLELRRRTGTSDSPWQTLCKHQLLRKVMIAEELRELQPSPDE